MSQVIIPENVEAVKRLRDLHQMLFPERYGEDAMYDADLDPDYDDFYEWTTDTIEWVAARIERFLKELGAVVPPTTTNWRESTWNAETMGP